MKFLLLLPTEIVIQKTIDKLIVEDAFGAFCLGPDHADITTILAKGLIILRSQNERCYLAIDGGYLVKENETVYISVEKAIIGDDYKTLAKNCIKHSKLNNKKKYKIKTILAKLEAEFEKQLTDISQKE